MRYIFQLYSNIIFPITSVFNKVHRSAFNARTSCGATIRRERESATQSRLIRDESPKRYARDARIANLRKVSTRNIDESRLFWRSTVTFSRRCTQTRSDTHASTSEPRENVEATDLGLICNFPFSGRRWGRGGGGSSASRACETKL